MRSLIGFELKKIWKKKVNRAAMCVGLALLLFVNYYSITSEYFRISEGEPERKGLEAIKMQAECDKAQTEALTEEYLTETVRDYQKQLEKLDSEEGYDWWLIAPKSNIFSIVCNNFSEWNERWGWEDLAAIDTANGIGFYERWLEKIRNGLNMDYSYGNYTEKEKEFWLEKAEEVKTPFRFGGTGTWKLIWTDISLLLYLFFVISICIAPVFAGEYQSRTDALLLTAKFGKTKLIGAKIIAVCLFCVGYVLICTVISVGSLIAVLGVEGYDLPVQLFSKNSAYDWTVLQAVAVNFLVMLFMAVFIGAFSMLLSARSKNSLVVLTIDFLLILGTVFIPFSKDSRLFNRILFLTPVRCADFSEVLSVYNSWQIGNVVLSYVSMIFITYIVAAILCMVFTGRGFSRHQVGGR
ncbi:MAG: ABC transporter permease [Roseburia sp.]|nr:ABC transporter permease [Roseburia sp.]MCM1278162.1 ABC transporter permease [Robinsoniella sp.]